VRDFLTGCLLFANIINDPTSLDERDTGLTESVAFDP